jgi:hypothetical protein
MNPYEAEADEPPARKTQRRIVVTVPLRQPNPALQPALDFAPPQPAELELSIAERFARFHTANPHVYAALRSLALAEVAQGARIVRTKHLFEQLRANGCAAVTAPDEVYRLNNIYTRCYARLLDQEPGLAGRIPMRKVQAE